MKPHPFKVLYSKTLAAAAMSCGLIACNGQVYTVNNPIGVDPSKNFWEKAAFWNKENCTLRETSRPCKFEGVVAYHPANFIEISYTTSVLKTKTTSPPPGGDKDKPAPAPGGDKDKDKPAPTPGGDQPAQKTSEVERTYKGSGAKHCEPKIGIKQVVRGDYEHPYQLYYDPGLLEKYTFKSEFEQGILKSLNTDSTPDRGETLKNIATVVAEIAKVATAVAGFVPGEGSGDHICTDEPVLVYIKRAEDVCKDGKCKYAEYDFKDPFKTDEAPPTKLPPIRDFPK